MAGCRCGLHLGQAFAPRAGCNDVRHPALAGYRQTLLKAAADVEPSAGRVLRENAS